MNVSNAVGMQSHKKEVNQIKPMYSKKISSDEVKEIKEQIKQNSMAIALNSMNVQNAIKKQDDFMVAYEEFRAFLDEIGYEGKSIASLSKEEASELVSEDGFFGIEKTSNRIAEFVINNAGDDEALMRAGREGMLLGFKQAQELWGDELPEISQLTIKAAIEKVDKAMIDSGFSIINQEA